MEPPEPVQEVVEWLFTLRLSQYTSTFLEAGYKTLDDCGELTEERLLELHILLTGHRRRILRSLEALGVKQLSGGEEEEEEGGEEEGGRRPRRKPVPRPRHVFLKDKRRGLSYQHYQSKERRDVEGTFSLPPGSGLDPAKGDPQAGCVRPSPLAPPQPAPRHPDNVQPFPCDPSPIPPSMSSCSSISSSSGSSSDWDLSSGDPSRSSTESVPVGFTGEMVENSIYESQPRSESPAPPRPTRSYRLRHRPVPKIPHVTQPPLQERPSLCPA